MTRKFHRHHGLAECGGLNRVFHCNHYNAYLQMAVLLSEGVGSCRPRRLLKEAVIPLVHQLRHRRQYTDRELLDEFAYCGFGKLRALMKSEWVTPCSHYGQAAMMHGRKQPSCFFSAGYISAITGQEVEEVQCKQEGSPVDWFKPAGDLEPPRSPFRYRPTYTEAPPRFGLGSQRFHTDIDEDSIIEAVTGLPLYGRNGPDDTGLIDAFGVVLTNHFADYYNYVSYETYFAMIEAGMPVAQTREIFVQGGHICAFNTFGGIMKSPEWYQLVAPHCRDDLDWIHGMVAVINALGWGVWRVESINPGRELVVRIYNSYEGVGFRQMYPRSSERQLSFLNMGAVQGLAHLLWKIDIKERPTLDHEFYTNVFNNPDGAFSVSQTHAIAAGDEYDRVVARRH